MSCGRFRESEEAGRPVSKLREEKRTRPKVQGDKNDFFQKLTGIRAQYDLFLFPCQDVFGKQRKFEGSMILIKFESDDQFNLCDLKS